jgi:hypothetical protein
MEATVIYENSNLGATSPDVQKLDNGGNGPQAYLLSVPDGVIGGQKFPVTIQGQQLMVTCPGTLLPGTKVRIHPASCRCHGKAQGFTGENRGLNPDTEDEDK